jgi:uncharacterized protein YbjQ (UPF0145 family)
VFVTRLSVNEFVLVPTLTMLGAASGSIAHHPQEQEYPDSSQIMKGITREKVQVFRAAFDRLEEQAQRVGASGVIGIRQTHREIDPDIWEYTVQGTAVGGCPPALSGRPFTCTLTGQEYFALTAAGYRPVGVAFGACVYYQKFHQRVQQKISADRQNVERTDFTRGIYTARRNALSALEAEAARLNAEGVLGIQMTTKRILNRQGQTSLGMRIELMAFGTAVVASDIHTPDIDYAVPLDS